MIFAHQPENPADIVQVVLEPDKNPWARRTLTRKAKDF